MSGSGRAGGRVRPRVDPALVLALAGTAGLLAVLRADLEVGATVRVLGVAGLVGAAVGATTRPELHRHGVLLLAVLLVPTIALSRWTGPYGVVWLLASGTGAIAGRRSIEVRTAGEQLDHTGRELPWMLVILAGLLLPLAAGLTAVALGAPVAGWVAVALATLVATDAPLVAAGMRGTGADGVVQPWRWPAYLGWLAIRLLLLVAAVVGS
jgi:hypothetical protein